MIKIPYKTCELNLFDLHFGEIGIILYDSFISSHDGDIYYLTYSPNYVIYKK